MVEFEIGVGAATYHTYKVSGKSIETRMSVFVDQLLYDIIRDSEMNQSKKVMALEYINRKQVMLSKKANNGANVLYAAQVDFKHNVRQQLLVLLFKKTMVETAEE